MAENKHALTIDELVEWLQMLRQKAPAGGETLVCMPDGLPIIEASLCDFSRSLCGPAGIVVVLSDPSGPDELDEAEDRAAQDGPDANRDVGGEG